MDITANKTKTIVIVIIIRIQSNTSANLYKRKKVFNSIEL